MKKILLLLVAGLGCWFVTMAQDTEPVTKETPKPKVPAESQNGRRRHLEDTVYAANLMKFEKQLDFNLPKLKYKTGSAS